MYLFDTDVLSYLAEKRRPEGLTKQLAAAPVAAQFTSAINAAEIYHGLFSLQAEDGAGARLLEFFEGQIFPRLTILPFERADARTYGRIRATLERQGRTRFEADLQIAAIALTHRLILVTGNVRHFEGIPGVKVENWLA
ncbi:MAG: PIN domain-containing protein [Acidobacteriota bacterium]